MTAPYPATWRTQAALAIGKGTADDPEFAAADRVLDALAREGALLTDRQRELLRPSARDAGRLQPAGGTTRTEYNLRFRGGASGRWVVDDAITSFEPEKDWAWTRDNFGDDCHQVHRTVTTYPDGSTLIGPWQPVPGEAVA